MKRRIPLAVAGAAPGAHAAVELDPSARKATVAGWTITVDVVVGSLTKGAADALEAASGTTGFAAGLILGRPTVPATGA